MGEQVYVPNQLDQEFEQFWTRVSCFKMQLFPYDQRCDFVKRANSCVYGTNVVPYMQLMACAMKCRNPFEEFVFVTVFLCLCLELVVCMIYVIHNYYGPVLKVVGRMMHMSEHLAGITVMSFANQLPEIFSHVWAVYDTDEPVFANKMALGVFVIMFVGGLICYISPFKMTGSTIVRDLLYLIFAVTLLEYTLKNDGEITLIECIIITVVYLSYLTVSVVDLYMLRNTAKQLLQRIKTLNQMERDSVSNTETRRIVEERELLQSKYDELSENGIVDILVIEPSNIPEKTEPFFSYVTRRSGSRRSVLVKRTDTSVAARGFRNKNRFLFRQFLTSIRPIFLEDWIKGNIVKRTFYIIRAPVVLLCALYIPMVDYEKERDGWSKLLNCIQIFLNPAITIVIVLAMVNREKSKLWYLDVPQFTVYGVYSMVITVPLAIIVFIHSSSLTPPKYHNGFVIMNFTSSVLLAMQCSTEISMFMKVIGNIYEVPIDFMGVTLVAMTAGLNDLVSSTSVSLQGYEKMAYAAIIGSTFLTVVIGCTLMFLSRIFSGGHVVEAEAMGNYAENAYYTLLIGLVITLLWTMMLNFNARRSVGIFSMTIYALFLLYAMLIKKEIIHSFTSDLLVVDAFST